MAEEQEAPDNVDEADEESPKKGGRLKSIMLIVVGLGLGTSAGLFFVGPRFFGGPSDAAAESTEAGEEAAADGHGEATGDEGGDGSALIHSILNLIVNPAGSGASRFLLVDIAVDLSTADAVLELEARDAAARDELLLLFGSKTVDYLADVANREPLKQEIQALVSALLTSGSAHEVFFPRFVIQ